MIASSAEGGIDLARLLLDLLIIIGAAKVLAEIAERLKVPAVLGEILAGVLVGPSALGLIHPVDPLEVERFSDHTHSQYPLLAAGLGDNGSRAGSRATAHSGRNEGHIRALEILHDFLKRFFSGRLPDFRLGARAQPAGHVYAKLYLVLGQVSFQCLRVRIADNKLAPLQI